MINIEVGKKKKLVLRPG